MKRFVPTAAAALLVAYATCAIVGCGDDETSLRPGFAAPDAAEASLPDAAPPLDGGDGGIPRAPFDAAPASIVCAVSPCATAIVAGARHLCVLVEDSGTPRCWGDPATFAAAPEDAAAPPGSVGSPVDGVTDAKDIAAGGDATCIVGADAGVRCWSASNPTPTAIPELGAAEEVFVSGSGTTKCARRIDGTLWCTGDSFELGSGTRRIEGAALPVRGLGLGSAAGFVIGSDHVVLSWGAYPQQLARAASSPDYAPASIDGPRLLSVASAGGHSLGITLEGELVGWGDGQTGTLGTGSNREHLRPVSVATSPLLWPQEVATASSHSCARFSDGSVWCWSGQNRLGELGYLTEDGVYVPARVNLPASTPPAARLALAENVSCAIAVDGSVRCWGKNDVGQLGRGTRDGARHPTPQPVVLR